MPTNPPVSVAAMARGLPPRWSITFPNGDVFGEPEWCAIDKFERQRLLLVRPPAVFSYLLAPEDATNEGDGL